MMIVEYLRYSVDAKRADDFVEAYKKASGSPACLYRVQ